MQDLSHVFTAPLDYKVDYEKYKHQVVSNPFTLEDVLVILFLLEHIHTEKLAISLCWLYEQKLCGSSGNLPRLTYYNPITSECTIRYWNSQSTEVRLQGSRKSIISYLEDALRL